MKLLVGIFLLVGVMRSVVFVDFDTKEPLVGVVVEYGRDTLNTDFDGVVYIPYGVDSISVVYVSYDSMKSGIRDTIRIKKVCD